MLISQVITRKVYALNRHVCLTTQLYSIRVIHNMVTALLEYFHLSVFYSINALQCPALKVYSCFPKSIMLTLSCL